MTLLAGTSYNPAAAVTKATSALLAMTAFDTTNLRLTFNAPASGIVLVRQSCTINGGAAMPSILLGVMSGVTVVMAQAPSCSWPGTPSANNYPKAEASFLVTGLTSGASQTWDAAYSVENLIASSSIKYGGPNNTTTVDAFGAFSYEIWSVT